MQQTLSITELSQTLFRDQQPYYLELAESVRNQASHLGADACELAISVTSGFSVTVRNGSVDSLQHQWDKTGHVTLYQDQHCASTQTSDISSAAFQHIVDKAFKMMRFTDKDQFSGLADKARLAFDYPDLDLYHPWDITPDQAIHQALTCEQEALAQDQNRLFSEGVTIETEQHYHLYANSHGFIGTYCESEHAIVCALLAKDKDERERDVDYSVARTATSLQDYSTVARQAARQTLSRLNSRRLKTQTYPVLFEPKVARSLIQHLIAAISGTRLYRKSSFLLDHLGQRIFPEHITIKEQPLIKQGLGSRPFDSEGVATYEKTIIDKGVLTSYILSSYSARRLNMETTGNAGGVTNIYVYPTADDFNQLVTSMDRGLIVTELLGQGVNLVTGDYSRGAFGFWAENGQVRYPVNEVTIAGNLKAMFQKIVAVGSDIDQRSPIHTGSWLIEQMSVAGE